METLAEAGLRIPMRVVGYCLMPNHFHLALWPHDDGDLSRWMHWVMTAHVRRYLRHYRSSGHVWQGRFKAFPIQEDDHLRIVLRYIERNPLRAALVVRAESWLWSSLSRVDQIPRLDPGPAPRGADWVTAVNAVMTKGGVRRRPGIDPARPSPGRSGLGAMHRDSPGPGIQPAGAGSAATQANPGQLRSGRLTLLRFKIRELRRLRHLQQISDFAPSPSHAY